MEALLTLLIYLIIALVILYAVHLILGMFAIRSEIKGLILLVVGLILLLFVLRALGMFTF